MSLILICCLVWSQLYFQGTSVFQFHGYSQICNLESKKKIKSLTVSIVSPCFCHKLMGLDTMIFAFWMLSFKPAFLLSYFIFIKRLFSFSLSAIRVVSSTYLRLLVFLPAILISAVLHPAWHFAWCTLHGNEINRMTIYSLEIFLSQFGNSPLFHVRF